jgi:hypothetical protein
MLFAYRLFTRQAREFQPSLHSKARKLHEQIETVIRVYDG